MRFVAFEDSFPVQLLQPHFLLVISVDPPTCPSHFFRTVRMFGGLMKGITQKYFIYFWFSKPVETRSRCYPPIDSNNDDWTMFDSLELSA
jgi:hypothetical protein